jgi:hypothetical protein
MAFPTQGGWKFFQAQTGWHNPAAMIGEDASIKAIRDHRLANPAITAKHNLSTDPGDIKRELTVFQQARGSLPKPQPSFFRGSRPSQSRSKGAAAAAITNLTDAATGIKRAAQGTAVVLDWLTSGGQPVSQELADKRAAICVSCPKNVPGSWYTVAPAELIRETLSARSDLKLVTPHDDKLQSCDVCKCLMRLKVWCPLSHILDKTKPEIMAEFPQNCWIARRDQ